MIAKSSPTFWIRSPHPWTSPKLKHKVKVIVNLNVCRSSGIGGGGLCTNKYAYYGVQEEEYIKYIKSVNKNRLTKQHGFTRITVPH